MNNSWLRNTIRSFEPYVVPEIKEHIVINANESPYNIFDFPQVKADFLERLAKTPSYHYPDPFAEELRAALAKYVGCQPQEVLVSNGGDEIISLIMNTFLNPGDTLLTHTPTFDIYGSVLPPHRWRESCWCRSQRLLRTAPLIQRPFRLYIPGYWLYPGQFRCLFLPFSNSPFSPNLSGSNFFYNISLTHL